MPRRGQSGDIRAGPSERGHQSGAVRAGPSEGGHQSGAIRAGPSEGGHLSGAIRAESTERSDGIIRADRQTSSMQHSYCAPYLGEHAPWLDGMNLLHLLMRGDPTHCEYHAGCKPHSCTAGPTPCLLMGVTQPTASTMPAASPTHALLGSPPAC